LRRLRRRFARRAARLLRGPAHPIASEPNPAHADPVADAPLFAIVGTWMEEDVVEATVANAFSQGAERVYLVDNGSRDETVARAKAAGAILAESFDTDNYQEHVRILLMNAVVARVSLESRKAHVWWLWMDADEFPEGADGVRISDYLSRLDARFRIVGSSYCNHFPSAKPESLRGFHPADLQPLCETYARDRLRFCPQPHFKHPLQRFDREGPFAMSIIGFHAANTLGTTRLLEPTGGIVTHHVQYRDEDLTRARMSLLCGSDRNSLNHSVGNTEIAKRFDSLDAVYTKRWDRVDNLRAKGESLGVDPRALEHPRANRWYSPEDLEDARAKWLAEHGLA
jgi:glycosyltransferase involved in cell wall biosynthesis